MLIISDNLRQLVVARAICDGVLVEEFSLGVRLDQQVRRPKATHPEALVYGGGIEPLDWFEPPQSIERDLHLDPGDCVLACSADSYRMPDGYFGFVQTKGTLARLFVSATCADGQVEPGFRGRITLELVNHGPVALRIPIGQTVAQLFLLRCSTPATRPYNGRYQDAVGPTVPTFVIAPAPESTGTR